MSDDLKKMKIDLEIHKNNIEFLLNAVTQIAGMITTISDSMMMLSKRLEVLEGNGNIKKVMQVKPSDSN